MQRIMEPFEQSCCLQVCTINLRSILKAYPQVIEKQVLSASRPFWRAKGGGPARARTGDLRRSQRRRFSQRKKLRISSLVLLFTSENQFGVCFSSMLLCICDIREGGLRPNFVLPTRLRAQYELKPSALKIFGYTIFPNKSPERNSYTFMSFAIFNFF